MNIFSNLVILCILNNKRYDNAGNDAGRSPVSLVPAKWQHIAYSIIGGVYSIYIDGSLALSGTAAGISKLNATTTWFGYDGAWKFSGAIDELKIFSKGLSQSDILSIYGG